MYSLSLSSKERVDTSHNHRRFFLTHSTFLPGVSMEIGDFGVKIHEESENDDDENVYFLRDMARVNRFDRSVQSGLRLSEISNIVRLQRSEYEQIVDSLYIVAQNKREP